MENNFSAAEKLLTEGDYEAFFRSLDDEKTDSKSYQFLLLQESRVKRTLKLQDEGRGTPREHEATLNEINYALAGWLYKQFVNKTASFFSKPEKLISGKIKSINWLEKGLEKSKSVCRIGIGSESGTGTIINGKYLLTCHHVLANKENAADARLKFNYVEGTKEDDIPEYCLNPSAFFYTDDILDFTICAIENKALEYISTNEPITLQNATLKFVKDVQIIQHPEGKYMQIALIDSKLTGTEGHRIFYTSDTESGSSGSPVFNEKWEVIGIHTSATSKNLNAGTCINFINDKLQAEKIKI